MKIVQTPWLYRYDYWYKSRDKRWSFCVDAIEDIFGSIVMGNGRIRLVAYDRPAKRRCKVELYNEDWFCGEAGGTHLDFDDVTSLMIAKRLGKRTKVYVECVT